MILYCHPNKDRVFSSPFCMLASKSMDLFSKLEHRAVCLGIGICSWFCVGLLKTVPLGLSLLVVSLAGASDDDAAVGIARQSNTVTLTHLCDSCTTFRSNCFFLCNGWSQPMLITSPMYAHRWLWASTTKLFCTSQPGKVHSSARFTCLSLD